MVSVLHWTWALAQTLVGLVYYFLLALIGIVESTHKYTLSTTMVVHTGRGGVSLGKYLFVSKTASPDMWKHELGHCKQSLMLGPLYLPIIGVLSGSWNLLKRFGYFKDTDYYSFWPERWATKLGNEDTT